MKPGVGMGVLWLTLLLNIACLASANQALYWDEKTCADIPDGNRVPHPIDCSLYYICTGNEPELFICSDSLLFNPATNQCSDAASLPALTPCSLNLPKDPAVIAPAPVSQENDYLPTCNNKSPSYLMSHPYDYEKYFICFVGTAYPQICPRGLHFSPSLGACALPSNLPSETKSLNPSGSNPVESSTPPPIPPYVNCTSIPDGTYLPDPFNCEIYYICVNQSPAKEVCPAGLYFNPDTTRCVIPADMPPTASCLQTEPPSSTTEGYFPPCQDYLDGTYLPHPSLCEAYYICFAGEATYYTCPPGLYFNPLDARCELPQNVPPFTPCLTNPVNKCKVSLDGTYLPDPADCQAYYVCLNGTANPYDCPPSLYFNPETNLCVVANQLPPDVPCSPFSTAPTTTPGPPTSSAPSSEDFTWPTRRETFPSPEPSTYNYWSTGWA